MDNGKATLGTETYKENYGAQSFSGRLAKDDICFQLGKCINLDFMYIDNTLDLNEDVDSIIGFARADERFLLAPGSAKNDKFDANVLAALKNYGEETVFSTRFQRDFISWIDIGTPDSNQSKGEPVSLNTFDDFFWSTSL